MWYVYIIRCKDKSLYTGVTTDIQRRFFEHKVGKIGAKYTRGKGVKKLVYVHAYNTRSEAQKQESHIKSLRKVEKERLVDAFKSNCDTITK